MELTLEHLRGRVVDLDSHEQIPCPKWKDVFGERGARFLKSSEPLLKFSEEVFGQESMLNDVDDVMEINERTVWETKMSKAPSAANMERRPAVLDAMGIHRQLVFPTFGLLALISSNGGGVGGTALASEDEIASSFGALDAYNEWACALTNKYPDRLRVLGVLASGKPGLTVDELVAETLRLIKMGARGVFVSSGRPPAGLSPSDPKLDRWYATLAEANVPLIFHAGGNAGFMASEVWGANPKFLYRFNNDCEYAGGPYMASNIHIAEENFITTLVLGAVFERHPTLRVGAIETFGYWIGPLAERLDFFCDSKRHMDWHGARELKLKPSEYLNRHVRVTPTVYEPLDKYMERYPYLENVWCYSTDYPHPEGNKWSMKRFFQQLRPNVSDKALEKFFVTNGQLLLP